MKNSWKPMSMECKLNALMELFIDSSHGSSPTPWITLKSKNSYLMFSYAIWASARTLLACIKNIGTFPCPRCLISKVEIPTIGTILDMQRRESMKGTHMDNDIWKRWVECARKAIYVKGKPITSKHVDDLLGNESLVPTQVSPIHLISRASKNT